MTRERRHQRGGKDEARVNTGLVHQISEQVKALEVTERATPYESRLRASFVTVPVSSGESAEVQAKKAENRTGMPDRLKSGMEQLSGMDLSAVRVHYNSTKPAQLNAQAYAQGTDIHLGPGQGQHLPHEAWHVVQQKQGRVKSTTKRGGVGVNTDEVLETEADRQGTRAVSIGKETRRRAEREGTAARGWREQGREARQGGRASGTPVQLTGNPNSKGTGHKVDKIEVKGGTDGWWEGKGKVVVGAFIRAGGSRRDNMRYDHHWALYIRVNDGKEERWIMVDLLKENIRVIQGASAVPRDEGKGGVDMWYVTQSQERQVTAAQVLQKARTMAENGVQYWNPPPNPEVDQPGRYSCQDFAVDMAASLGLVALTHQDEDPKRSGVEWEYGRKIDLTYQSAEVVPRPGVPRGLLFADINNRS